MLKDTGRFAFFRQLIADGVTCMFGNPGSSEENLLDALRDPEFAGFQYYLALHEGPAVAMADSYARALQRPAVVQLHSYAGLANGLGMMYYARRGYSPLVVIAGEAGLRYEALDGQMAADLPGMARLFVKADSNGPCAWRVTDSGSLLRLIRRAVKTAMTPPRGPVFLALPMDLLDQVNTEPVVKTSQVQTSVAPDRIVIEAAARHLSSAERPLILMGDGIAAAGAQAELTAVAEILGAEVWGANCSDVNMAASHPLFEGNLGHMFGADSRPVTSSADVVLICGTTVLPEVFPALEGVFASEAKIIHFDLNTTEIGKNFPVTIGALADPRTALAMLVTSLSDCLGPAQIAAAKSRMEDKGLMKAGRLQKQLEADNQLQDQIPLHAPAFMRVLARHLPANALVFDEALTHSPELCRYLPQDQAGAYFQTRAGMLGTGLPGTIGLKVAHPDREVWGFSGDGGSISTIQALATAARHQIAAKFVVCNNRSYRILKYNLQRYWRDHGEPTNQPFPPSFDLNQPQLRFDLLAQAQGVEALRVEHPGDIEPAIQRALEHQGPFLIDLILSNDL